MRTWKHTQQACQPSPHCASVIDSALGMQLISHGYPVNSSSLSRNMSTLQTGTCVRNPIASGDQRLPVSSLGVNRGSTRAIGLHTPPWWIAICENAITAPRTPCTTTIAHIAARMSSTDFVQPARWVKALKHAMGRVGGVGSPK